MRPPLELRPIRRRGPEVPDLRRIRFRAYEGELALARKDYVAAEKAYLGVLSLHPESVIALNNLAWIAGQLRKDSAIG